MLRRNIIKVFYYYLVFSITAFIFLFGATMNSISDGQQGYHKLWFNESNQAGALVLGVLVIHQMLGLMAIIFFKRNPYYWERLSFIVLCSIQFLFFIAPSLLFLLSVIVAGSMNI